MSRILSNSATIESLSAFQPLGVSAQPLKALESDIEFRDLSLGTFCVVRLDILEPTYFFSGFSLSILVLLFSGSNGY
jgi:hypothetical protein